MKRDGNDGVEDPMAVLDRRLASGEIDRTEYEGVRKALAHEGSTRHRRTGRALSTSGIIILVVLGVVVAFAFTSMALTYGPWRTSDGGTWPWDGCCNWGGQGGMGGGMMGGGTGGFGSNSVAIVNYAYAPQNITISAGTAVTWVNMDHVMHTVSFGEHGDEHEGIDSGPMNHMDSWSYTFSEPGVYEYHCDPHPYMTGTVIVEA